MYRKLSKRDIDLDINNERQDHKTGTVWEGIPVGGGG
jgi:hypothetical protein